MIVDLPLPPTVDPGLLDELSRERPELAVVFRWGLLGQWATEAPGAQLGRSVRQALALRFDRPQSAEERRQLVQQLARQQQAFLELSKSDLWDFEAALARITTTAARVLRVARMSVWELSADDSTLRCLTSFDARTGERGRSPDLRSFPRYLESLESSLLLAAHDAQRDPRTQEFLEGYLQPLGITAMLDAPIRRDGRVAGVMCHEHVGDEPRRWSVLEQCAASTLAGLVARALEVRDRRLLEARAERLERFELIGGLAGGVAHDLNNLLMVLLGNLELASAAGAVSTEQRASLEQARASAQAIRGLTNDLLEVGRRKRLDRRLVDLRAWLSKQEPILRAAIGANATLDLIAGAEPLHAEADADALARVLLNLVKNAGEALTGPGTIDVSLARVVLGAGHGDLAPGAYAALAVRDDGAGMTPETLRHLFEPFFSTKELRQGHGLGLATSYGLVRQHGGTIRVDSELGVGSRFQVLLPLASDRA
ncbi:MAG: GAF domain-containing protein [Planctomycetes bacterium]|nr:GAF domain-containing protein [Planctomycetota bacterium]